MAYNCLPNEILSRIIQEISPDDVVAFSSVNRHIYSLSSERLAHHKTLKAKYGTVVLDDNGICHPIKLLFRIWKDPSIAYYIKYIVFACNDDFPSPDFHYDSSNVDKETWDMIKQLDNCEPLFRSNAYFSQHEDHLQECRNNIRAGKQSAAFALLLVSLPNLARLRYSCPDWNKSMLLPIFRSGVLSKVSTIEAYHRDTEGDVDLEELAMWVFLPSVRTFKGANVGFSDMIPIVPGWQDSISYLERVEVSGSSLHDEDLKWLLLPLQNLREVGYYHECHSNCGEPLDVYTWVNSLAKVAGDRLEVLSLTNSENGKTTTVDSFKAFKNLRKLEIQTRALVSDKGEVPRLIDILPPSIQTITLFIEGFEKQTQLLLRDMATEKQRYVPNLSKFIIAAENLDQGVEAEIRRTGIAMERKPRWWIPKHAEFWCDDPPDGET